MDPAKWLVADMWNLRNGSTPASSTNYLRRMSTNGGGAAEQSNDGSSFGLNVVMTIVCLICAALASGLTQGLLSLDITEMTIKSRKGSAEEKLLAQKVLPIIKRHHLLLVTLMLWNASAAEALPVFLNNMVPEWAAIVISVTLVLFVGEIIPAAVLTGPKQLKISASLTPLVYFVTAVFFIVAYPISLILDHVLGRDEGVTVYNRMEISEMVNIQKEEGASLHKEEVAIIDGALRYTEMLVQDVMTPVAKVFMISAKERLNYKVKRCAAFSTQHSVKFYIEGVELCQSDSPCHLSGSIY
jgi:metal transporter CNNM